MKTKVAGLVLFLAIAGSVAFAAARQNGPELRPTTAESQEAAIPRVVVVEKRAQSGESPIRR